MGATEVPNSPAVRLLRARNIVFAPHFYDYKEHGGTTRASSELGVDEHSVIKTLVFQTDTKKHFLVLMHGDREVSTKQLARIIGTKTVVPADPATAQRVTGYMVGGISPFGTRNVLPVYAEETIFALPHILINGGKRGFLVGIDPRILLKILNITKISASIVSPE